MISSGTVGDVVRRAESHWLSTALDATGAGRRMVVELVGEPGSGKTWLLRRVANDARSRGLTVLNGQCRAADNPSLHPFREMFDTAAIQRSAHRRIGPPQCRASDRLASRRPEENGAQEPLPRWETLHAALERRLADAGVILLDDFQAADRASVDFLLHLLRHPLTVPYLLVVAHRARQASACVRDALSDAALRGEADRVALGTLSLAQAAELIGLPPADSRVRALHRAGGGNPLYLQALAHTALGTRADGPSDPARDQFEALDTTDPFVARILAEIEPLAPEETAVVTAAAALDDPFDLAELAAVAQLDLTSTCRAVGQLTRRDLFREHGDHALFEFRHPVVKRSAYWRLDACARSGAHRRALAVLSLRGAPVQRRAIHLERIMYGLTAEDRRVLAEAAARAPRPELAVRWLESALRSHRVDGGDPAEYQDLRLRYARALGAVGRPQECLLVLDELLGALPPEAGETRVEAVALHSLVSCGQAGYAQARARLSAELSSMPHDPPPGAAPLVLAQGIAELFGGSRPPAERLDLAVRLAREGGGRLVTAGALALTALARLYDGDPVAAERAVSASRQAAGELTEEEVASHPEYLAMLGWAELLLSRFPDAETHFARGVLAARRGGSRQVLAALLCGLSGVHHEAGRPAESRRSADEAAEAVRLSGAYNVRRLALALRARAAAWDDHGDLVEMLELAERAFSDGQPRSPRWDGLAVAYLVQAMWMKKDHRRCVTILTAAGGGSALRDLPPFLRPMCFETLTAAAVCLGRHDEAVGWADQAELAAAPVPAQRAYARVARADLLIQSDPRAAIALYRQSAELFAAAGMADARSRMLARAARSAALAGQWEDFADLLAMARGVTGTRWETRLARDLRDGRLGLAPGGPSPREPEPLAVLTRREREVAEIVATGKRTREIAQELRLSPRTVDVHLARIYRKLNLSSRTALGHLVTSMPAQLAVPARRPELSGT